MKILVTGASGGLGGLVIEKLLSLGHDVVATSRDTEKAKNLEFYTKVNYIAYDIQHPQTINLFDYFQKPDALIHLAWEKLNEYKNPAHLQAILPAHKTFLENLIQHGLKNITVAGTCYEYGIKEGELEENMPGEPIMPYPEAKNLLRIYLQDLQKKHAFSIKWARVFYVFGEIKGRKNLYTLLLTAILNGDKVFNMSGGEQVRDFLSPRQIAAILVDMALQTNVEGIINCCSGQPVKLKEYVQEFLKQNSYSIQLNLGFYPYPDYEPMTTWGSVAKLKGLYGAGK